MWKRRRDEIAYSPTHKVATFCKLERHAGLVFFTCRFKKRGQRDGCRASASSGQPYSPVCSRLLKSIGDDDEENCYWEDEQLWRWSVQRSSSPRTAPVGGATSCLHMSTYQHAQKINCRDSACPILVPSGRDRNYVGGSHLPSWNILFPKTRPQQPNHLKGIRTEILFHTISVRPFVLSLLSSNMWMPYIII